MNVKEKLQLLNIKEVTTERQKKNGTRIFQLPIKKYGKFIEVGSFESGYVRRMDCEGYRGVISSYQLNKCENYDHFYKEYKWCDERNESYETGKYNKHVGKKRILIPNEVDRLEYLIAFCLKNYYINQANLIENGKFIPKWKHEYEMENGSLDKVRELQLKVMKQEKVIRESFEEIDRISEEKDEMSGIIDEKSLLADISVTVNGERYKII